jgi:hypothetical protein
MFDKLPILKTKSRDNLGTTSTNPPATLLAASGYTVL